MVGLNEEVQRFRRVGSREERSGRVWQVLMKQARQSEGFFSRSHMEFASHFCRHPTDLVTTMIAARRHLLVVSMQKSGAICDKLL